MKRISAILFDKDGTLFDFRTTWGAWARQLLIGLSNGDPAQARRLGRAIGYDLDRERFASDSIVIAGTAGEVARALSPHVATGDRPDLLKRINAEAARAPQVEAAPLGPLLGGLRARGLVLGVATNDAEAPARAHLDAAGITGEFAFIAGFDSGHGAKPGPGQLLAFAASCDLAPDSIAMVGDSTHDLSAGRAAGMVTVGVLTGMASREVLAPLADVILDGIADLPEWLDADN